MTRIASFLGGLGLSLLLVLFFLPSGACGGSKTSGFNVDSGSGADGSPHGEKDSGTIHLVDGGGGGESGPCTGLACQVKPCGTSISGTVFAPNGTLPLYNVQVYIPNAALSPLPRGVQCENCGAALTGDPITTALTDSSGKFTLANAPDGDNIPIVVQLGKWRRQTTIPKVTACVDNPLTDPNQTRLPKNQTEGNMPHIALTTGGCDQLGCMLPKIGIDPAEFGYEGDGYNKAVNTYNGSNLFSGTPLPATAVTDLWGNESLLATYDMAVFSCECTEPPEAPAGSPYYANVQKYLNAGGRIFTTDFQYAWYKYSPDPAMAAIGSITGGAPVEGSPPSPVNLVTTFPKGMSLADWLQLNYPSATYGQVVPDVIFGNFQSITSVPTLWATSPDGIGSGGTQYPRVLTVNAPVTAPTAMQCGKAVHIDVHIDQNDPSNVVDCGPSGCYPASCTTTLKEDEAMFAFFFFDLSSCIQKDTQPPPQPK